MMAYEASHLNNCGGRYRHPGYAHDSKTMRDGSVLIMPNEASSSESLWNPTLKDISERARADALAVDLAKFVLMILCM